MDKKKSEYLKDYYRRKKGELKKKRVTQFRKKYGNLERRSDLVDSFIIGCY